MSKKKTFYLNILLQQICRVFEKKYKYFCVLTYKIETENVDFMVANPDTGTVAANKDQRHKMDCGKN